MKKTWIIILSVLTLVIVTVVTLCFTLFTVQDVTIDFRTSTSGTYDEDQIISSSGIKKGKNIFFLKKDKFSSNIEKAYPYLEVINIETRFPSKLTIHLRERQSVYAVQSGDKYYLIDNSQKVLEEIDSFDNTMTNPILITQSVQATVGEKIHLDFLSELYDAMLLCGKTRADMLGMIEKADYFESKREVFNTMEKGLKLTLHSGREVFVHNAGYGLAYKLARFFDFEQKLSLLVGKLSDEVLTQSEIHIDNLVDPNAGESEGYCYLVYKGEKVQLDANL